MSQSLPQKELALVGNGLQLGLSRVTRNAAQAEYYSLHDRCKARCEHEGLGGRLEADNVPDFTGRIQAPLQIACRPDTHRIYWQTCKIVQNNYLVTHASMIQIL